MNLSKASFNQWRCKFFLCTLVLLAVSFSAWASSHREAPLISNDPLADNTDVYAFRSPDNPNTITIIANYVPMQLPHGGPNYYTFGENIRYEIHIDNDASKPGDEIIYRFTFQIENEDPTTFFNMRLGKQNLKTTYTMERSMDGGASFTAIITNGVVPPYNVGPRSIESPVGLGASYPELMMEAISTTGQGEQVFCGPVDDAFFVDLGGIFDLGDAPRQNGEPSDGVACYNVSTISIQVPIELLLKEGVASTPANILDPDYVIGVWASASRRSIRTLTPQGEEHSGDWVQVSRLGMPLTNEVVIPIGMKDFWNALSPYDEITDQTLDGFFYNPELALYMDDDQFGGAVPAFTPLRIQRNSLGSFDFGNGQDGLFGLKGNPALAGTALDDAVFGTLLLPGPGLPRSVDLWPAFHTGVPNVIPYQLATGKGGNPLAAGKPFVHNFLPNGGDMLRLNMAVPVTPRDDAAFSSLGLIQAAVLGLTDPTYNQSTELEFIPNMDGFPNGRRLEDDVTRIELQAVSGVVLAAIGLWYDDFDPDSGNPVTQDLIDVLSYSTGVETNDLPFQTIFPYQAAPHDGTGPCSGPTKEFQSRTADLEISIQLNNTNYEKFQQIPYRITVQNKGNLTASGVTVFAGLPETMVFTSATPSKGSYDLFFETWTVGELGEGESATLELVLFTLDDQNPITNFVEVLSSNQSDPDSDPGNDIDRVADEDDEASITITPGEGGGGLGEGTADLELSISADKSQYEIFENVVYTIQLTNNGPDEATNVSVKAGLPATMVFTAAAPAQGDYNLFFERWNVGTLASGASVRLQLTLFTLADDASITNFVQLLSVDQMDPDSKPANNGSLIPAEDDEAAVTIQPGNSSNITQSNGPQSNAMAILSQQGLPNQFNLSAYPNLLRAGQNVTIELFTEKPMTTQLLVTDASGALVQKISLNTQAGINTFNLETALWTKGMYLLNVLNDEFPMPAQKIVIAD